MEKGWGSIKEVAEAFGMRPNLLRQLCHARGQLFASQPVKNGNIIINVKKFEKWLGENRPEFRRRIKR